MQSIVLIACPVTNDLVTTGARATKLDELAPVSVLTACESCGEDHDWTREDAVIPAPAGAT